MGNEEKDDSNGTGPERWAGRRKTEAVCQLGQTTPSVPTS